MAWCRQAEANALARYIFEQKEQLDPTKTKIGGVSFPVESPILYLPGPVENLSATGPGLLTRSLRLREVTLYRCGWLLGVGPQGLVPLCRAQHHVRGAPVAWAGSAAPSRTGSRWEANGDALGRLAPEPRYGPTSH
jgi:hypothetical protein